MGKSKPFNMVYDIPSEMAFTASFLAIYLQTLFLHQTQNCLMEVLTIEWPPLSYLKLDCVWTFIGDNDRTEEGNVRLNWASPSAETLIV